MKSVNSRPQSSVPVPTKVTSLSKRHAAIIFFCFLSGFLGAVLAMALFMFSGDFISNPQIETKILTRDSEAIAEVANNLKPSVVSIDTNFRNSNPASGLFPGGGEGRGAGTGVIISEDGLVVTNRHVVAENLTSVTIIDSEGESYQDIELVDRDTHSDIAFLRIKADKKFKPASLGKSSEIQVGERVIAIGNALGMFSNTVTAGIISGTSRPITASDGSSATQNLENLIQTDASINPGNSGGPLVNLKGEVIGINTAVASNAENIGFAIPIDEVKPLVASVEETGRIIRPFIGVNFIMLNPAIAQNYDLKISQGALVVSPAVGRSGVIADGPAAKAGIKDGDVITKIGTTAVDDATSLVAAVNKYKVGDKLPLEFNRDGRTIKKQITLEKSKF